MHKYLVLNSEGEAVAHCQSAQELCEPMWRLEFSQGEEELVWDLDHISLVGADGPCAAAEGHVVRRRDNMLWVEAVRDLGSKVRENLRIPVQFESFVYLPTGRLPIESADLSCGGIAFFCDAQLKEGEQMEVVIPVTSQPLVLRMKILRQRCSSKERTSARKLRCNGPIAGRRSSPASMLAVYGCSRRIRWATMSCIRWTDSCVRAHGSRRMARPMMSCWSISIAV